VIRENKTTMGRLPQHRTRAAPPANNNNCLVEALIFLSIL
jgi:hypothetical protein